MTENDRLIYGGAISRMTTALEREREKEGGREGGRKDGRGVEKCSRDGWREGMQRERKGNDRAKQTAR